MSNAGKSLDLSEDPPDLGIHDHGRVNNEGPVIPRLTRRAWTDGSGGRAAGGEEAAGRGEAARGSGIANFHKRENDVGSRRDVSNKDIEIQAENDATEAAHDKPTPNDDGGIESDVRIDDDIGNDGTGKESETMTNAPNTHGVLGNHEGYGRKPRKSRETKKLRRGKSEIEKDLADMFKTFGTSYWETGDADEARVGSNKDMGGAAKVEGARAGTKKDVGGTAASDDDSDEDAHDTTGRMTELHSAAASGDVSKVATFIKKGVDTEILDNKKATALHHASKNSQIAVIKLLRNSGANIDAKDTNGKTPLYWAAKEGHASTVKVLLDLGANTESKTDTGWTALHVASRDGHVSVMKILLRSGSSIDARSIFGITPLHLTAIKQQSDCLLLLLDFGANPKVKSAEGISPIDNAVANMDKRMVEVLLKSVCPGLQERTYDKIAHSLFAGGKEHPRSELYSAVFSGDIESIKLALEVGLAVDLEETDDDGRTLLHLAVEAKHNTVVELLLMAGADLEAKTKDDGSTPLLLAAKHKRVDLVTLLLDKNADIEAKTTDTGRTALHIAANVGNGRFLNISNANRAKKLVLLLLKRGAYAGAMDAFGLTPLQLAQMANDQDRAPTDVLLNPPAVEGRTGFLDPMPPALKPSNVEKEVCQMFNMFLVDFDLSQDSILKRRETTTNPRQNVEATIDRVDWLPRIKSVFEVNYKFGPSQIMAEAHKSISNEPKHLFRWIHIPANNDLVHKICRDKLSNRGEYEDLSNFVGDTENEHWGTMAHSRYMKTSVTIQRNEGRKMDQEGETSDSLRNCRLAAFMPFLNFDTDVSRKEITAIMEDSNIKSKITPTTADFMQQSQDEATTPDRERDMNTATVKRINTFKPQNFHPPSESEARHGIYSGYRGQSSPDSDNYRPVLRVLDSGDPFKPEDPVKTASVSHRDKHKLLIQQYLGHDRGSIHLSRTLDQFYYDSIDTQGRDTDQVVYRFSKIYPSAGRFIGPGIENRDTTAHGSDPLRDITGHKRSSSEITGQQTSSAYSGNPRIFTVDQLWIWVIDEETIISCFPQRWGEEADREPRVLESIQHHLRDNDRPQIKSAFEMAALITSYCMRFADMCRVKGEYKGAYFEESFLHIYGSAISRLADKETELFRKFQEQVVAAKEKQGQDSIKTGTEIDQKSANMNADSGLDEKTDITGEIEVLKEIKDIRDEVNILQTLLGEQKSVTDKLFGHKNGLPLNRSTQDYYFKQSGLENRIRVVDKMDRDAETIFKHVNILLDLKQKQASIDEALAAARQGSVAAQHSKIAADQGAVVMIFTLVTIIFLPMTFLTSLYALNINSFPHNPSGNLAYEPHYIFPRLFGISSSIAVVLVSLAFQVRRIRSLFGPRLEPLKNYFSKDASLRRRATPPPASEEDSQNSPRPTPRNSYQLGFRGSFDNGNYKMERKGGSTEPVVIREMSELGIEARSNSPVGDGPSSAGIRSHLQKVDGSAGVVKQERGWGSSSVEPAEGTKANSATTWVERLFGSRSKRNLGDEEATTKEIGP